MNIAQAIIETLKKYEVDHLFGTPGDSVHFLMEALKKSQELEFIQVGHEEGGALAASAQAKSGAKLSACIGSSGPGIIHLLNGLYDAKLDGAPVLAITGQVETSQIGLKKGHEIESERLLDDVTCFNQTILNAESAVKIIDLACRTAIEKNGVAHISLPLDMAYQNVELIDHLETPIFNHGKLEPNHEDVKQALRKIEKAQKPVVLAGRGCLCAQDEFELFINKIKAPVIKTLRAKSLIDDEHPHSLGGLGRFGIRPAYEALQNCDLLIVLGTDFPFQDYLKEPKEVIQVDTSTEVLAASRSHPIELPIHAHIKDFLQLMNDFEYMSDDYFLNKSHSHMKAYHRLMDKIDLNFEKNIIPQNFMRVLGMKADDQALFTCDSGLITSHFAKSMRMRKKQRVYFSGNLGAKAFSVSAALGLQLQSPKNQVISIIDAESLNMLPSELGTISSYGLPIKIFIVNRAGSNQSAIEKPNYEMLAKAYGIEAKSIQDPDSLEETVELALQHDGPYILNVEVHDYKNNQYPILEFDPVYGISKEALKEIWESIQDTVTVNLKVA